MLASSNTDVKLEDLKVFVEEKVAADLEAERQKTNQAFAEVDVKFDDTENQISDLITEMGRTAEATRTAAQQYTNQKVDPAIKQVNNAMAALETKINNDVGKQLETVSGVVDNIMKSLKGTAAGLPGASCDDISKAHGAAMKDGEYWIDSKYQTDSVLVFCQKVGSKFVSMGGDGSNKANAAAGCEASSLVANNEADKKWIDPDANAEDTGNAAEKVCSYMTCKDIKDKTKTTKSGVYKIKPKDWTSGAFEVWCDMTRDGGGWTLTEMHTAGWSNQPVGRHMADKGANVDKLLKDGDNFGSYRDGNMGDYASLGEAKINAIYHSFGEATILRNWNKGKYFRNHGQPVNWYYQKKKPTKNWSIFHAIRNTKLWSGQNYHNRAWSRASDGFKLTWKDPPFNSDTSVYDPNSNRIKNERGNRGYMYWWEEHTISGNSGKTYRVSRHGIPGDPFGGCQWNFYFWGGNGQRSHGHCGRMRMSFYWLR